MHHQNCLDRKVLVNMKTRQYTVAGVLVASMAMVVSACTGSSNSGNSAAGNTGPSAPQHGSTGQAINGGTVTIAEQPGDKPTWIFPIVPAAEQTVYNLRQLQAPIFPPLYYYPKGSTMALDYQMGAAEKPRYSKNNTVVTIDIKKWQWSDGSPVGARDVIFNFNLLKAAIKESPANFGNYTAGLFPDNVKAITATGKHQLKITLTRSVNPQWYTPDQLQFLTPIPQHAWDKTSTGGKIGNYDETPTGAKKVYDFLKKQAQDTSSYASNPLWQVSDGPYRLTGYDTTGKTTMVRNPKYSGSNKPKLDKVVLQPFTSEASEFSSMLAGKLDIGAVPTQDFPQISRVKDAGYNIYNQAVYGTYFIVPNFHNPTFGPIVQQLYFRQAIERLIDQKGIIKSLYKGFGVTDYGPIPPGDSVPYASTLDKNGTYHYNEGKTKQLLKQHGWSVTSTGTDTCMKPGTGPNECGKGIPKGKTLEFTIDYNAQVQSIVGEMDQLKSSAADVGIKVNLRGGTFNTLISEGACKSTQSSCNWDAVDWGNWNFNPYPVGNSLYATGAPSNHSNYSDSKADKLINQTLYGSGSQALTQYENYLATQLPVWYQPDQKVVFAVKKNLGTKGSFLPLTQYFIQPTLWYRTKN